MTLRKAVIDCNSMEMPCQLAVAIGRVSEKNQVCLKNFKASNCITCPVEVTVFYGELTTIAPKLDLTCCSLSLSEDHSQEQKPVDNPPFNSQTSDSQEEDEDEEPFFTLITIDLEEFLMELREAIIHPTPLSEFQQSINVIVTNLFSPHLVGSLLTITQKFLTHMHTTWPLRYTNSSKLTQGEVSKFYSAMHKFQTSQKYTKIGKELFEEFGNLEMHVLFRIFKFARAYYLKIMTERVESHEEEADENERGGEKELTDEQRAKVRHVAGWCVAKVHYAIKQNLRLKKLSTNTKLRQLIPHVEDKKRLIETLIISQPEISSTTQDPASLQETIMKQNCRGGLKHVTDLTFHYFLKLCSFINGQLTTECLTKWKGDTLVHVSDIIKSNMSFLEDWQNLIDPERSAVSKSTELFHDIVSKFPKVFYNQFRKDWLDSNRKTKQQPLRTVLKCLDSQANSTKQGTEKRQKNEKENEQHSAPPTKRKRQSNTKIV